MDITTNVQQVGIIPASNLSSCKKMLAHRWSRVYGKEGLVRVGLSHVV